MHRYNDRVLAAAESDTAVAERFLAVMNLTAPPTSLFHPTVLARVGRHRSAARDSNR